MFSLKFIVSLLFLTETRGHGFLQIPRSRNLNAYKNGFDYDFMGLNGGGPRIVQSNALFPTYIYPDTIENSEKRHGMCGDIKSISEPYNDFIENYPIFSFFHTGDEILIETILTAHHMGHFEFYLCNLDDIDSPNNRVTQECLFKYRLERVPIPNEISPIDENYPYRFYIPPIPCMEFQTNGYPGYKSIMKYKLPDKLECKHCVLQWWYFTANSCYYDGYESYQGMNKKCKENWYNPQVSNCKEGNVYPEEFWNCADIQILPKKNIEEVPIDEDRQTKEPTPIDEITIEPTKEPTIEPTIEPTKEPTSLVKTDTCHSIDPRVTDEWCIAVNCDSVYREFCSSVSESEKVDTCYSIDPRVTDEWCISVNCDYVYKDYCSLNVRNKLLSKDPKIIIGYYLSWNIYEKQYFITDIHFSKITHLIYSFVKLNEDGTILPGDRWADLEFPYSKKISEEKNPPIGNFEALKLIKEKYPHLKILLSM